MKCPKCSYENPWSIISVFSRDDPCLACGYDMDGVIFSNKATTIQLSNKPIMEVKQ